MKRVDEFSSEAMGGEASDEAAGEGLGSAGLRGEEDLRRLVGRRFVRVFEGNGEGTKEAAEAAGFPEEEGGGEGEKDG